MHKTVCVHSVKMREVEEPVVEVVEVEARVAGMWASGSNRSRNGSKRGGCGNRSSKPSVPSATPDTAEFTSSRSHEKRDYRKKTLGSKYPFKVTVRENSRSTPCLFPQPVSP